MTPVSRLDEFEWGSMHWLAEGESVGASMAIMKIASQKVSPLHRHHTCNEIIHVTEGKIFQRVGEEWFEISAGETVIVPSGVLHQTGNKGDGDATLTICYSSGVRDYEEISG